MCLWATKPVLGDSGFPFTAFTLVAPAYFNGWNRLPSLFSFNTILGGVKFILKYVEVLRLEWGFGSLEAEAGVVVFDRDDVEELVCTWLREGGGSGILVMVVAGRENDDGGLILDFEIPGTLTNVEGAGFE